MDILHHYTDGTHIPIGIMDGVDILIITDLIQHMGQGDTLILITEDEIIARAIKEDITTELTRTIHQDQEPQE